MRYAASFSLIFLIIFSCSKPDKKSAQTDNVKKVGPVHVAEGIEDKIEVKIAGEK